MKPSIPDSTLSPPGGHLDSPSGLHFGFAFEAPETEPIRQRLKWLLSDVKFGCLRIESLFNLFDLLESLPAEPGPERPPEIWLIFDLQRLILFRDDPAPGTPGLASLLYFLLDGYPLQPFAQIAAAERGRPYRLCFDPACLDLIPTCLLSLIVGQCLTLNLVTGEISATVLQLHPYARGPAIIETSLPILPPLGPSPLAPCLTDASLRSTNPPDLSALVSEPAGIIRRDNLESDFASLPFATTQVSWNKGTKREFCFGKALTPTSAQAVARCEAIERFQLAFLPPGERLIRGTYKELRELAVDPENLFLGRSTHRPADESHLFDPEAVLHWTWAWSPAREIWQLVPAQVVWFDIRRRTNEESFAPGTTNACALGMSFEEASLFASFEAIERDAFLTSWYLARPATEIDLDSVILEEFQLLRERFRLAFPRYRPLLFDLTSDIGIPTVGGLALREFGDGPRIFASAASHLDAEHACFKALKDLTGFQPELAPARVAEIRARLNRPGAIIGPSGHFELFALDESFERLSYLELGTRPPVPVRALERESPIPLAAQQRLDLLLRVLGQRLNMVGAELYLKDLTHPNLAEIGIKAVRAITPGLYPMWFGNTPPQFAVTGRLRRLAELYTGRPFDPSRLQLTPHPLS